MKTLFFTLALCSALLIGGFSFWQSTHAGATAFTPSYVSSGATTYVPTHKGASQSSSGRSLSYDPWARAYQPS